MTTLAERRPRNDAAPTDGVEELRRMRVLLVHEWLYTWAGAERVLEQLVAMMPHADILAGIVTPELRRAHPLVARTRESWVGMLPGSRARHRWFLPLHPLAFATYDTSAYDLIISISHAFEKSIRARGRATHLCYCLTPPRYLYDLHEAHSNLAGPVEANALRLARPILRAADRVAARGVHRFVSLSQHVAERVRRSYGRRSAVVHPPVAAKESGGAATSGRPRERFLLTIGRLVPYKRIDLAIRAAERLQMRLVVAGDGPERERLTALAAGSRHVELVGSVSEMEAARLLGTCAAFVFCAEEDFGIAPVEANAHGTPVVAFGRGGVTETLVDGSTAVFFHEQTVDAVAGAIERCLARDWDSAALRANARRFSPEHFRDGMREQIAAALQERQA